MSWAGWFEYDGTEIINVHRVEAYTRHHGWFNPVFSNTALGPMLNDTGYSSPWQDDPPWADPDVLDSYDFLGVYPLDVAGLESSTRTSAVVESTGDGGIPGRGRHATKQVVFNTLLLADSEAGAEYGMRWLRRALAGGMCGTSSPAGCFGATLCYLSSEPEVDAPDPGGPPDGALAPGVTGGDADATGALVVSGGNADTLPGDDPDRLGDPVLDGGNADDLPLLTRSRSLFDVALDRGTSPVDCLPDYLRSLRNVTIQAPTLTAKRALSDGGQAWMVTFTVVAGNPFEFGTELEVIRGFLDPAVDVPWAGGVEPPGAGIDLDGYMATDEGGCVPTAPAPLYDPDTPALILPPSRPSIPLGNFTPPSNWRRRQFTIPKQYIPLWGEMVPLVRVHARAATVRNLRVRFYADPFLVGDISDDPCAFCGDIIVSYVPKGYTMVLDGAEQVVYVIGSGGVQQRADSLVFASDGTPFTWPTLSCGFGYVVTLDLPAQQRPPVVDLSLLERAV